jgi:hypothetical protein
MMLATFVQVCRSGWAQPGLVKTYIHTSIHIYFQTCALTTQYLYPLCTIHQGRYLFGRHCRCGQQRYICTGLSGFYAFEIVGMYICISVVCVFACLLKVCKFVSLPSITYLTYIALNLRDRASATLPFLDWDLISVLSCSVSIGQR